MYENFDTSGVASTGTRGQIAPFASKKCAKNWEKEGKNQEKLGKRGGKEENLGRFFHFAPPDR